MAVIQTNIELGLAIRSRRKALGWDQAELARRLQVTRQWVINIEKGKPRAELELALRALRELGLLLIVEPRVPREASVSSGTTPWSGDHAIVNIDAVVDASRLQRKPTLLDAIGQQVARSNEKDAQQGDAVPSSPGRRSSAKRTT